MKNVVSFSGGKDSTAMLLLMLEKKEPIHSVVFFDTDWEFPEIYFQIEQIKKLVKVYTVRYWRMFDDLCLRYGFPHKSGGWCTAAKRETIGKYMRGMKVPFQECIGFTTDETKRTEKPTIQKKKWPVRFPLIDAGFSSSDSLQYCLDKGYNFGGLYDWMPSKRVSCFCCPKQSKKDWEAIKTHRPFFYKKAKQLSEIKQVEKLRGLK